MSSIISINNARNLNFNEKQIKKPYTKKFFNRISDDVFLNCILTKLQNNDLTKIATTCSNFKKLVSKIYDRKDHMKLLTTAGEHIFITSKIYKEIELKILSNFILSKTKLRLSQLLSHYFLKSWMD